MIKCEHGAVEVNGDLSTLMAETAVIISAVDRCIKDAANGNDEAEEMVLNAFNKGIELARASKFEKVNLSQSHNNEAEDIGRKASEALDFLNSILKGSNGKEQGK